MVDERSQSAWRRGAPGRILLATDWSARCDRPLDRAIQLAHYWGAWLTILTVVEHEVAPSDRLAIEQRLKAYALRQMPPADVRFHVDVAFGRLVDETLALATRIEADLIVTGVGRRSAVGDYVLGTSVDQLMRAAAIPLLIAKQRARYGYERIMVASHGSDCSTRAFERLPAFPRAHVAIISAGESTADAPKLPGEIPPVLRDHLEVRHVVGEPVETLAQVAHEERFDLSILCRHRREGPMGPLLGGTVERLAVALETDVLVVP